MSDDKTINNELNVHNIDDIVKHFTLIYIYI